MPPCRPYLIDAQRVKIMLIVQTVIAVAAQRVTPARQPWRYSEPRGFRGPGETYSMVAASCKSDFPSSGARLKVSE